MFYKRNLICMQKTINALNTYWAGKKVAIKMSDELEDYEIGKLDHFEWYVDEDYLRTQMPKMKAFFTEKENADDNNLEVIIDVNTFAIKEFDYER